MADVTRWIFHPDDAVNMPELDPDGRLAYQGPFEYVPLADHLAALERVRVETLREARAAIDDIYPVSDQWGHHTLPHIDRRAARAAIDRLIALAKADTLRKPGVEG